MILSQEAARVLGCLIEKSQATPEYYPMTLNALVAACNQKNSRDPVVDFSDEEVEDALRQLRDQGLCAFVSGEGRVKKYAHRCGDNGLELSAAQQAALSLLLLRGPQTLGEIKNRSGRQYEFASLEEVQEVVNTLINREPALVEQAPRQAGQKEVRYRHLFTEHDAGTEKMATPAASSSLRNEIEELKSELAEAQRRLERLEEIVARMKADLY
jgi:uncharacterized protein YceH (UPF0502 family)